MHHFKIASFFVPKYGTYEKTKQQQQQQQRQKKYDRSRKYDNVDLKIIFLAFCIEHTPIRTKLQHDKINLALCPIP